ncbi:MAG: hypothetical protein D6729_03965 [Deltaproteobacteria bacterium]|nr:MAG: hypothetical protein D6729_03965 [Deltaproteobacteria bacterium]
MTLYLLSGLSALALAAMALLRRRLTPTERNLVVESRAALGQRSGLVVVRFAARRLLVAYGEGTPTLLAEAPAESEEETP